ncbi:MAG: hypothetical protein HZC11_03450 [Nitrospirae bacterium]|nr:hypothetical protein [Nitrospirota bacterium]
MFKNETEEILADAVVLKYAFQEHLACIADVYSNIGRIIISPPHTPQEFYIAMDEIPEAIFTLKKNIFSTLFQSVYYLLGIRRERRELYAKLNHLFRIWVTSADNLLDDEDKVVVPIRMPGDSHVMRQVISIMAADRIMKQILDEAIEKKVISSEESAILSDRSLQILLPSAAEEASEENGIRERPDPEYVFFTIHRLKTGLLFHIPFLGPDTIENNIDANLLIACKDALGKFGLGCQLLDDIRDMSKDYSEKRHNYVLSKIYFENRSSYIDYLKRLEKERDVSLKVFNLFPEVVYPAAIMAIGLLKEGLYGLNKAGLHINERFIEQMALSMFKILDVGELIECIETQYAVMTG